jgi:predicted component of type VI protein secretion system
MNPADSVSDSASALPSQGEEPPMPTPEEIEYQRKTADAFAKPIMELFFKQMLNVLVEDDKKARIAAEGAGAEDFVPKLSQEQIEKLTELLDARFPQDEDPGCLEVIMDNGKKAYVKLDACARDYDLSEDFNKLVLSEPKMAVLKRNIGLVIHLVRLRYLYVMRGDDELVEKLHELTDYSIDEIRVDQNTTLYVNPDHEVRAGFFVVLEDEVVRSAPGASCMCGKADCGHGESKTAGVAAGTRTEL